MHFLSRSHSVHVVQNVKCLALSNITKIPEPQKTYYQPPSFIFSTSELNKVVLCCLQKVLSNRLNLPKSQLSLVEALVLSMVRSETS